MLWFSLLTQFEQPAAHALRTRLTSAALELGVADPMHGEMFDVFQRTFARPVRDPAYKTNRIQPGALPLEWSFSEIDPGALRIELQPFDPTLTPMERLRLAVASLLNLVEEHQDKALVSELEAMVAPDSVECSHLTFGAFLGLVHRPDRSPEYKMYIEITPDDKVRVCSHRPRIAGLTPHFRSVAVCAGKIYERTYYLCQDGLRILDLEALCAELGISHRFPALLVAMLELTGGEFFLPPRSVLLGMRRAGQETDLKVELVCGTAINPDGLFARIERLLQPNTVVAFRRWAAMVCPKRPSALLVTVVSVKISVAQPVHLSVYAAEPWGDG
jgi:hypothetical protein